MSWDAGVCDGMTYAEIEVALQTNSYTFLTFRRKSILMTLPIATMINSTTAIEVGNLIATLYSDWNPLSWSLNVKKISSSLDIRYSLFTPVWYLLIPHKLGYSSLLVRSTPLGVGFSYKPLMQIRLHSITFRKRIFLISRYRCTPSSN